MAIPKEAAYTTLVAARKRCARCIGLTNPARFMDGRYDSNEIGPWSRWQGALDSELMVVGQDWGDTGYMERHEGLDIPGNPTNRRLHALLAEAGFDIEDVGQTTGRGTIFLTNAILCLKVGGLGGPVRASWFNECGPRFLRQQVELIRPRGVVALGAWAYRTLIRAFDKPPRPFRIAVEDTEPFELLSNVYLFPVYHCSPRVLARTRIWGQQVQDWRRIRVALGK